ncbi:hypothetical protein QYF36_023538 [Acer negundo]|nr:hypothetical protein QYF36_023538 [Acer negundo]
MANGENSRREQIFAIWALGTEDWEGTTAFLRRSSSSSPTVKPDIYFAVDATEEAIWSSSSEFSSLTCSSEEEEEEEGEEDGGQQSRL